MDESYIRERLTQLRIKKGVSEYQMSYDLGHSKGYMNNISSGKSLPPLKEFLKICEYLDITPGQFFDDGLQNPDLTQQAIEMMRKLNREDMTLLLSIIRRFAENKP